METYNVICFLNCVIRQHSLFGFYYSCGNDNDSQYLAIISIVMSIARKKKLGLQIL